VAGSWGGAVLLREQPGERVLEQAGEHPVLLGTTTPVADLGVCTYDFRLKNTPTALRATAAGTVTVRSALGGESLNQTFTLL